MNYIGIDLGGTNIKGALVSAEGNILQECSMPTCVDLGTEAVASRIGQVIAQLSDGEAAIGGVGVGCPGTVDDASGIVRFAANLNFINFDLRSALRAYTALPIHLGNDANAAALGEALFGCGKGAESTIVVTLGTGVGGGVIIDGKLFQGFRSAGAELGHVVIRMGGAQCTCGRKGCFEAYASATALIRQTREAMEKHPESKLWDLCGGDLEKVEGKTAFDGQALGDETAKRIVSRYVKYLAEGLVNICNEFRPEAIVLGGGVCGAGDVLLKPLKRRINRYIYGGTKYAPVKVVIASLGNDAGLVGAVKYAIDCVSAR